MTISSADARTFLCTAALPMLAVSHTPAHGQPFEPGWRLAVDLAFVNPSAETVAVDVGLAGVDVDFDNKAGAGLRAEYRFTESLAAEIGVLGTSSFDVRVGDLGIGLGTSTRIKNFAPVTVGGNYHFAPESRVDLYAGVFAAFVRYGDIDVQASTGGVGTSVSVDTDFGWGAIAGLELPLGAGGWLLQTNVRYIDTNMQGTNDGDPFDGDFDPFIFSIGFGYRF